MSGRSYIVYVLYRLAEQYLIDVTNISTRPTIDIHYPIQLDGPMEYPQGRPLEPWGIHFSHRYFLRGPSSIWLCPRSIPISLVALVWNIMPWIHIGSINPMYVTGDRSCGDCCGCQGSMGVPDNLIGNPTIEYFERVHLWMKMCAPNAMIKTTHKAFIRTYRVCPRG